MASFKPKVLALCKKVASEHSGWQFFTTSVSAAVITETGKSTRFISNISNINHFIQLGHDLVDIFKTNRKIKVNTFLI